MKKIYCDACGKEIDSVGDGNEKANPYFKLILRMLPEDARKSMENFGFDIGMPYLLRTGKDIKKVPETFDICSSCAYKIYRFVLMLQGKLSDRSIRKFLKDTRFC